MAAYHNRGFVSFQVPSRLSSGIKNPSNPWTGPEVSRRLRLPDFQIIGTW
jgi:hypothetical protein